MYDGNPLKPADIAKIFGQSLAWVSKNYRKLGGVKVGGRMFFPPREVLYDRLFCREERVAVRLHDEKARGTHKHGFVLSNRFDSRNKTIPWVF